MRFIPKALKLAPLAATVALAFSASGALAQEVLKIGLTAPLSGGAALYGKNVLNGLNLAAKEINDRIVKLGGAALPIVERPSGNRPCILLAPAAEPAMRQALTDLKLAGEMTGLPEQGKVPLRSWSQKKKELPNS